MSDMNDWPSLVSQAQLQGETYATLPFNEYQLCGMARMIWNLDQAGSEHNTGDWYREFARVVYRGLVELGAEEITDWCRGEPSISLQEFYKRCT